MPPVLIIFQYLLAFLNDLSAHILGKQTDMCLIPSKTELVLQPFVCLSFGKNIVLPDGVKRMVRFDAQVSEISVCQCSFRDFGSPVNADIRITGRIMLADINIFFLCILAVNIGCRTEDRSTSAVGTFDGFHIRFQNISSLKTEKARAARACYAYIIAFVKYFWRISRQINAQMCTKKGKKGKING